MYELGCDINSADKSHIAAAVQAAKSATVAILVMGIDQVPLLCLLISKS